MVQVLPGVADQLLPSLDSFAQGLEKYMKPNHDFQIAMQKAIGSNPNLAQQLADLEYNAPGTLNRMGFGQLGDVVAQIPESEKSQLMRTSRGEILASDKQKLSLDTQQTGFDLDRLNDTINFLKDPKNQAVTTDEILRRLTGETSGQRAQTAAATEHTEVQTEKAKLELGQARKTYDETIANLPELQGIDFMGLARDFIAGRANGSEISAIMNTPGAGDALNKAITAAHEERQDALREKLEADREAAAEHRLEAREDALDRRSQNRQGTTDDKTLTREAFQSYAKSRYAGTLAAWKTVLNDPEKAAEIQKKPYKDLTQPERDVLQVLQAQERMQDAQNVTDARSVNSTIAKSISDLRTSIAKGDSRAIIDQQMNSLNGALSMRGQRGGNVYTAHYGPIPAVGESDPGHYRLAGRGEGVYFTDESGNRVSDDKLFVEPKKYQEQATAEALRAYTTLKGMAPDSAQAELKVMMAKRPDVYKQIVGMDSTMQYKPFPPPKPVAKPTPPARPKADTAGLPAVSKKTDPKLQRAQELAKDWIDHDYNPQSIPPEIVNDSQSIMLFQREYYRMKGNK